MTRRQAGALLPTILLVVSAGIARADLARRPDPYSMLGLQLDSPRIDAVSSCLPDDADAGDPPAPLVDAIQSARAADDSSARTDAASRLQELLRGGEALEWQSCGWVELARLQSLGGRHREAATSVLFAERSNAGSDRPPSLDRAIRFHRAEARLAMGEVEAARGLFDGLAGGGTPVARAARLRLAELEHLEEPGARTRERLESRLRTHPGVVLAEWAPGLAEAAIREGELDDAAEWIDLALASPSGDAALDGVLAIRRADLLAAAGDRDEGLAALRAVAEEASNARVRRLAELRWIDWTPRPGRTALRRLERTPEGEPARLRSYANALLARNAVAAEEHRRALELLVRVVHDGADAPRGISLTPLFTAAMRGLAAQTSCDEWVAAVGARRELLMRHTSAEDPFLRLGDCFLELGMASAALQTYRDAAKSFGPDLIPVLTYRTARAEQAIGAVGSATAVARSSVSAGRAPRSGWRSLLAEIRLAEERPEDALALLLPEFQAEGRAAPAVSPDADAAVLASRAAVAAGDVEWARRLHAWRIVQELSDERPESLAEASLQIADLNRMADRQDEAVALYRLAADELPPGPLRSRALYWLETLSDGADAPDASSSASEKEDDNDTWARLARERRALAAERLRIGPGDRSNAGEGTR